MGVTLLRRSHLASAPPTAASCHGSGLRGWTGELRKLWDEDILYKTRSEGEATVEMYVLSKKGAADYGARGHYDPPKHWFPCVFRFSFVFTLLCQGNGGGRHERGAAKRG